MTETASQIAPAPTIKCADAKLRRDELTKDGWCINGKSHGAATHGRLCAWCRAVHRHGVQAVLADPKAPPRPPGYQYRTRGDERPAGTVYVTPPL